jgi:hypothetical protein
MVVGVEDPATDWVSARLLVSAALLVAAVLALVMACTEAINDRPEMWRGPPDEYGHRAVARYYVDHWLPPRVGDPATLDSYSRDYGYSYINDPDPAYPLAGKVAVLVSPLVANHDLAFRLFNVTLLALLALLCALRPAAWPIFAPLLVTPQAWYIFSYFNGDALPLFLTFVLAYEVAYPQSAFNRSLDDPGWLRGIGAALLMGVIVGLLLLSKKNYLAFAAFLPAALALQRLGVVAGVLLGVAAIGAAGLQLKWFTLAAQDAYIAAAGLAFAALVAAFAPRRQRTSRARVVAKLAILAAIGVALFAGRAALDTAINGSVAQKLQAQSKLQEQIARPEYKPSQVYQGTNPQATYYGLGLRARGTPLRDIFGPFWSWHTKTFTTFTGSYGWLTFNSPKPYAILLVLCYVALMGSYAWGVARSRSAVVIASFALAVAFTALTIAVAVFHSWNDDFQAQGRYLFPALGMLGVGLMHARATLPTAPLAASVGGCFLLSVYSFVFVGLAEVQRAF